MSFALCGVLNMSGILLFRVDVPYHLVFLSHAVATVIFSSYSALKTHILLRFVEFRQNMVHHPFIEFFIQFVWCLEPIISVIYNGKKTNWIPLGIL